MTFMIYTHPSTLSRLTSFHLPPHLSSLVTDLPLPNTNQILQSKILYITLSFCLEALSSDICIALSWLSPSYWNLPRLLYKKLFPGHVVSSLPNLFLALAFISVNPIIYWFVSLIHNIIWINVMYYTKTVWKGTQGRCSSYHKKIYMLNMKVCTWK